jgi:2-dehydropantoate 2-reductase
MVLPTSNWPCDGSLMSSTPVPGILDLGRWPSGTDTLTVAIRDAFRNGGFASEARQQIASWKYAKLLDNLSNVIDALCGPGARHGPLFDLVREEGERCLHAAGISYVSPEEERARRGDLLALQDAVGQPRLGSSTWQSLARRSGKVETDYLNGEIVLLGRLHGIATPANELLQRLAREYAGERRAPATFDADDLLVQVHRAIQS